MRPSRNHTPEGFQRNANYRWGRMQRRWSIRLNGLRRGVMRELGYEHHAVPVYPQLARRAWR